MFSIIPIIIIRLVFLNDASFSSDRAFDDFNTVLLTSIHTNLSIVVTCIPFVKPIMDGIQSGILASDVRSQAPTSSSGYLLSTARKRFHRPEGSKYTTGHTAECSDTREKRDLREKTAIMATREISIHNPNLDRNTKDDAI